MPEHRNVYNTKLKNQILSIFIAMPHCSFSAQQIYSLLHENGYNHNITSVYRNLDSMTSDGVLMKFQDSNFEKALYQYAGSEGACHTHLHMKCVFCGEILHLDCSFMRELDEHINNDHGFTILCDRSVLYGICSACKNKSN